MEKKLEEGLKEVQKNFQEAMDTWMDIMNNLDVKYGDAKLTPRQYDDETLMNMMYLFVHTLQNVGIHKGLIDHTNAITVGLEFHDFVKKYTGLDSREYYRNKNICLN